MKSFLLSIFSLFLFLITYASDPEGDFVQYKNQDPISCKSIKFKKSGGNMYKIHYVDSEGNETKLKGKGNCEKLVRFSVDGVLFELIPLDPEKPNSYMRHFRRVVDGYIVVWYCSSNYENFTNNTWKSTSVSFTHVKIGNNTPFRVTNKEYKKKLKPIFEACEETSIYRGYLTSRVAEMSKVYNENCAN